MEYSFYCFHKVFTENTTHLLISLFSLEKLAEATRKYGNLKSELAEALENEYKGKQGFFRNPPKILQKHDVPARKLQELKLAFSEFYLSLILLQNYQNLNFTGFRKIMKKHDKVRSLFIYLYELTISDTEVDLYSIFCWLSLNQFKALYIHVGCSDR